MSKRGPVSDYAGEPVFKGDLITYGSRRGNTVRLADAIVHKVYTRKFLGRMYPMMLVAPTGDESGFVKRDTMRKVHINTVTFRVIEHGVVEF